jgi:Flp pilus assembly protein TadG
MVMKDHAKSACQGWISRFLRNRAGSIAPLFAVAAIPLTIAIGSATDIGRMMDVRSQMQDISDSAALAGATKLSMTDTATGVTIAQNFLTAAVKTLPGSPTLQASTSCTAPAAAGTNVIVASICVPAFVTSGTSVTATIQVMMANSIPTTFAAIMVPTIAVNEQSTAQGNVGRLATFSINNFNSSAYDLDQIYWYLLPSSLSGVTGEALYKYTPTLTSSNLILSNATGFTNKSQTISIGYGDTIEFAMSNTTGGHISYSPNCYGMTPSTAAKLYYSHRTAQPTTATTQYYDYGATSFNVCAPSQSATVSVTDSYSQLSTFTPTTTTTKTCNGRGNNCSTTTTTTTAPYPKGTTMPAGNYIYPWGYSRNPLQFGVLNRNSSTSVPTGGTTTTTNDDCTTGDVTYNWDDNGGGDDDYALSSSTSWGDFNDIVFTVNCQSTMIQQSSIKLVS